MRPGISLVRNNWIHRLSRRYNFSALFFWSCSVCSNWFVFSASFPDLNQVHTPHVNNIACGRPTTLQTKLECGTRFAHPIRVLELASSQMHTSTCTPPHAHLHTHTECDCDPRGTVGRVCRLSAPSDQCPCKNNTESETCSTCRDGFFGIDASNPEGCSR